MQNTMISSFRAQIHATHKRSREYNWNSMPFDDNTHAHAREAFENQSRVDDSAHKYMQSRKQIIK